MGHRAAWMLAMWLGAGCGFGDAPGDPLVVAHRSAAGHWPENSRTAVQGALAAGYPALEVDVVLTADDVPVLSHDVWLNEALCTEADGGRLGGRVYVQELTLDALRAGYRCGGLPDPEQPEAQVVADTHLTLAELTEALAGHPDVWVNLDVKYEPGHSPPPERIAAAILAVWRAGERPNPWYVSADRPEVVEAFEAQAPEVTTFLSWPRFSPDASETGVGLVAEAGLVFGWTHPVDEARDAGADGLSMPYQLIDRLIVEEARSDGLLVTVWTLNDPDLLARYCAWPVDRVVTDHPERAPCL